MGAAIRDVDSGLSETLFTNVIESERTSDRAPR